MRLWLQNKFLRIAALDISCHRLLDRHANVRSYVIEIATIVIFRGIIICYSDHLTKIGGHVHKEIIEFVSITLFTDNVNPIAFKMAGKFKCVSFRVNN